MATTAEAAMAANGPKDLYEIGEIPPLGHVPKNMYAWAIRKDRHGEPEKSFQVEVVPTWELDSHDVLVLVMAAGVNYNGVWAGLGTPISPIDGHKLPYHIAGSDAAGIVWAVGSKVKRWKVGDEVVVHCNQDDGDETATTRSATAATRCSRPASASGATRRRTAPSPSSPASRTASSWSGRAT